MKNETHYFDWDFIRAGLLAYYGADLLPEINWESMIAKRKEFPKSTDEEFLRATCTEDNRVRLKTNKEMRANIAAMLANIEQIQQYLKEQIKQTQESTHALCEADTAARNYLKELEEAQHELSTAIYQLQESANAAIRRMSRGPSWIDTLCAFYLLEHYTNKIKGRP